MEDNAKLVESLLERAADFGKTSIELGKLKILDNTSDTVSTLIPHTVVAVLSSIFMLFLNLGLAFWLGELSGKIYLGFFIVGAFYGILAFVLHFFLHKKIKKLAGDYFIKHVLNKN